MASNKDYFLLRLELQVVEQALLAVVQPQLPAQKGHLRMPLGYLTLYVPFLSCSSGLSLYSAISVSLKSDSSPEL
ncbi:hypothetical protein L1887_20034 [Cichorium endivia]|nr:hypothetical protein L1887_20034 [Cichorium endivia]